MKKQLPEPWRARAARPPANAKSHQWGLGVCRMGTQQGLGKERQVLRVRVLLIGALALMVTLSLSAGVSAAPVSADKVKAVIQSAYDDEDKALVAHDLDGVMAPYAEDAIFIDDIPGAKRQGLEHQGLDVARQNWVDLYNVPRQTVTSANHEIKEITVSKTGGGATILTVRQTNITGTTKAGRTYLVRIDTQLRHFWAKTGGGWRIKQERLLSIDTYRDGRLDRHNRHPVAQ